MPEANTVITCNCNTNDVRFYKHAKTCPFYYMVLYGTSMSLEDLIKVADYAYESNEKYGPGWSLRQVERDKQNA